MARRAARYKSGPKKGQFKPKAKRRRSRRASAATKRRKARPVARKRRRRRRRGGGGGGSSLMANKDIIIAGAANGFLFGEDRPLEQFDTAVVNKVPKLGNKKLTRGLVLWYGNKYITKNRWVKKMALAELVCGARDLGAAKFKIEGGGDFDDDAIDVTEEGEVLSGELG